MHEMRRKTTGRIAAKPLPWAWRYGIAVLVAVAALVLRFLFAPWLGGHAPYVTYMVAVAVSVWLVGFGPALVTAAFSIPAALVFVMPGHEPWPAKCVGAIIYGIGMLIIAFVGRSMQIAQAKAQAAESLRRLILDVLPMKVAMLDGNGIVTAVNQRWSELQIGTDYLALCQKAAQGGERTAVEAYSNLYLVLKGKRQEATVEYPCDTPTKSQWFMMRMISASPVTGEGVLIAHIDISERKRMEESLRLSETRYRMLFESMDEGFCVGEIVFDQSGKPVDYRFLQVNPSFEKQTGLPAAQGKTMSELAGGYEESWFEIFCKVALTGQSERFQKKADVLNRWYDVFAFSIDLPQGRLVAIIFNDITIRKQLEEDMRRGEENFRQFADSMPQIVWSARPDGVVDFYNRNWYEQTGAKEGDIGDNSWLPILHPDDRQRCLDTWHESLRTSKSLEMDLRLWIIGVNEYHWHLVRGIPAYDRDGNIFRWFGTATDVHNIKQIEEQLRQTASELSRSNQDLEQFASVASHDLQEPLRMVTGHLQIVQDRLKEKLDDLSRESMFFAIEGASRMQALIRDLLAYSRVGRGATGLVDTNMNAVLSTALSNLRVLIEESGALVEYDQLPTVKADISLMSQLLQNLIGNAIKYCARDRKPKIRVTAKRDRQAWVFAVSDNGIGIRPEDQERIFMIFQRLHSRHEYPGTGIGLAICKRIVEYHSGRIWVESELGQGSTFLFTVPDRE